MLKTYLGGLSSLWRRPLPGGSRSGGWNGEVQLLDLLSRRIAHRHNSRNGSGQIPRRTRWFSG